MNAEIRHPQQMTSTRLLITPVQKTSAAHQTSTNDWSISRQQG